MGKKDATKREKSSATKAAPVETAVTPAKPASVLKAVAPPVPTKSIPTLLYMLATRASFEHKEDLADAMNTFKNVVAVVLGLIFGFQGIKGETGVKLFLMIALGGSIMVARNWLGKEDEEVGGTSKLLVEGTPQATAVFFLVWSIVNTVAIR